MPFNPAIYGESLFRDPNWILGTGVGSGYRGEASSPADAYIQRNLAINPNWVPGMPEPVKKTMAEEALTKPQPVIPITPVTAPTEYTVSPTPTQGNGPFGAVPGQIGLPNPAGNLQAQIPGLAGLNAQTSGVLSSYLGGELPPDVQAQIQNAAAQFGVSSGMPGAGLVRNRTARDLGLTSLDLQRQGLAAYNPFVSTVSSTQTLSPALQAQIAEQNALNAAAPNPAAAASHAEELYNKYLDTIQKSGRTNVVRPPVSNWGNRQFRAGTPQVNYAPSGGFGYSPMSDYPSSGFGYIPQASVPSYGTSAGYGVTAGGAGSFDTFLNDALGVPEVGTGGYDVQVPYAPDYNASGYDSFLNDALGGSGWNEQDYYDWFGG